MLGLITHNHKHGQDFYHFETSTYTKEKHDEFLQLAIEQLEIDYDEDGIDENISLEIFTDIPKIDL